MSKDGPVGMVDGDLMSSFDTVAWRACRYSGMLDELKPVFFCAHRTTKQHNKRMVRHGLQYDYGIVVGRTMTQSQERQDRTFKNGRPRGGSIMRRLAEAGTVGSCSA